jgi:hypothetical protein
MKIWVKVVANTLVRSRTDIRIQFPYMRIILQSPPFFTSLVHATNPTTVRLMGWASIPTARRRGFIDNDSPPSEQHLPVVGYYSLMNKTCIKKSPKLGLKILSYFYLLTLIVIRMCVFLIH